MMYQSKLVASLKANGKILREFKDTVYIPFGSEYSFLIKNLNTTRALVNVFIDGDNIIDGGLVINAGQEVDLERYVKNGNLKEGNRFKFIERTSAVEQHRGVKLEDGVVRIEFQFEKPQQVRPNPFQTNMPIYGQYQGVTDKFSLTASGSTNASYSTNVNGMMRGVDFSNGESVKATAAAAINKVAPQASEMHDGMATMDWNDAGITVPGSKSTQAFSTTTMGEMETEKHTIVLKLLGMTAENQAITMPVTVKHKPKCVTCNKQNKATAKFCTECGTALEIFA
jgi:hypothetical protein